MSSQATVSMPATTEQIVQALEILFSAMRFRPGVDGRAAIAGYVVALEGLSIAEITSGLRKVLRGEVEGINKAFCPSPPELAEAVRSTIRPASAFDAHGGKRLYAYRTPASKIIARRCSKDFAASLVRNGAAPRGSIWCPGKLDDNPHIGDLYGPDETWRPPVPL